MGRYSPTNQPTKDTTMNDITVLNNFRRLSLAELSRQAQAHRDSGHRDGETIALRIDVFAANHGAYGPSGYADARHIDDTLKKATIGQPDHIFLAVLESLATAGIHAGYRPWRG